ncbi:MAG: hypothetical protein ACYCPQ_08730 [Elusimicrobiota bacterium]
MKLPIRGQIFLTLAALVLCLSSMKKMRGKNTQLGTRDILRGRGLDDASSSQISTYQRLRLTPDAYLCEYGFKNFNQDDWNIHFSLNRAGLARYERSFGYTRSGVNLLSSWKKEALRAGMPPPKAQAEYQRKLAAYFTRSGFKISGPHTVEVNMPALVKENAAPLRSVAAIFERIGSQRNYDSDDLIGAVTAMVQTAVRYKETPQTYNGRDIGGVLPPLEVLAKGWGDCDTKSGLLAAILANWPRARMVGVAAPDHYLMGVLRIPQPGDYYVQYKGLQYILIEAAGPAWLPPGTVFDYTASILRASDYKIEPFF